MYLPPQFANQAIPNNKLAPNLAKKGIRMERYAAPELTFTYFNMENPTVGGNATDKVALRRAIGLAYNTEEEIRLPRRATRLLQPGSDPAQYLGL